MDADKIIEAFEQLLRAYIELYKARWGLGANPDEDIFYVKAKQVLEEIKKQHIEQSEFANWLRTEAKSETVEGITPLKSQVMGLKKVIFEAADKIDRLELDILNAKADKVTAENECCNLRGEVNRLKAEVAKLQSQLNKLCELSCYEDITKAATEGRYIIYSMRILDSTYIKSDKPLAVIDYIFNALKQQFYTRIKELTGQSRKIHG